MDPDHDLICDLYPWMVQVMEDQVKENYFKILCDDDSGREIFDEFWPVVPKHCWSSEPDVKYMWEDFNLLKEEPWIF